MSEVASTGSYCFDPTTGELVEGTRYDDHPWGPMVECDCRYPYQKPNCANPVSDCLPGGGGTAAGGG